MLYLNVTLHINIYINFVVEAKSPENQMIVLITISVGFSSVLTYRYFANLAYATNVGHLVSVKSRLDSKCTSFLHVNVH